ncbi:MAG: SHOCT domain-containing protein [Rhodocyclales bacterium]|nr:SHOCT domain-containing protein [Rhodocyclales bacterium]
MSDFGWGGIGFGPIFMLLFWGVFIVGIIAMVRWLARGSLPRQTSEKTAGDIVRERYARGEIDQQEYEQKMQDLDRRG